MDAFTIERQTLEPHQLERRFATLRQPEPKRLAALERSLAHAGQLQPLIAVPTDGPTSGSAPFVLLDGYRRLEALGRLERDTAQVAIWHCPVRASRITAPPPGARTGRGAGVPRAGLG